MIDNKYLEEKYGEKFSMLQNSRESLIQNFEKEAELFSKQTRIIENTPAILDDLDRQFCEKTGLTSTDVGFLFVAVGLQMIRQYLLTSFPERMEHDKAANKTPGYEKKHSDRSHKLYNPSLEEIRTNPVPFDANVGSDGALKGGGSLGHRATAIGHDPLLGLVFGTANIATSTLTTASFESYHIWTNEGKRDYFRYHARTDLVLKYTMDKLLNQGLSGKAIIVESLKQEIVHLNSDLYSKNSLPLPVVSAYDPMLASKLANYGLDMANAVTVSKQASYALFINALIAMVHRLFWEGGDELEEKLYEVRTRKILSYSNLIATSTNIAVVAVTKDFNKLDLGGLAVTLHRLITDKKFIKDVKEEFVFGKYKDMFLNGY